MIVRGRWATVAIAALLLSGCAESNSSEPPPDLPIPAGLDREPDAVGTLSATWIAGSGGPVEVTADRATWGLTADDESMNGAQLGIKRTPVDGVENGDPTLFFDGDGNEIPDLSGDLWDGQAVRVWCDMLALSQPPICSVSHLQLSHAREG